jgi:hypothetical protein
MDFTTSKVSRPGLAGIWMHSRPTVPLDHTTIKDKANISLWNMLPITYCQYILVQFTVHAAPPPPLMYFEWGVRPVTVDRRVSWQHLINKLFEPVTTKLGLHEGMIQSLLQKLTATSKPLMPWNLMKDITWISTLCFSLSTRVGVTWSSPNSQENILKASKFFTVSQSKRNRPRGGPTKSHEIIYWTSTLELDTPTEIVTLTIITQVECQQSLMYYQIYPISFLSLIQNSYNLIYKPGHLE